MGTANKRNRLGRRAAAAEILQHSPLLIEGLQFSPKEFYAKVEQALVARQVPDIAIERIDWKEGGALSARREYLRIRRERLIFDICAAPFGAGFFVSTWFGREPLRVAWLVLIFLAVSSVLFVDTTRDSGLFSLLRNRLKLSEDEISLVLLGIFLLGLLIIAAYIGPHLDQFLIRLPLIGAIYERYFRKITYYRHDLACCFRAAVDSAVQEVINEISKAQPLRPYSEFGRRPSFQPLQLASQGSNGHQ